MKESNEEKPVCFVIMPIANHPDYEVEHFKWANSIRQRVSQALSHLAIALYELLIQ